MVSLKRFMHTLVLPEHIKHTHSVFGGAAAAGVVVYMVLPYDSINSCNHIKGCHHQMSIQSKSELNKKQFLFQSKSYKFFQIEQNTLLTQTNSLQHFESEVSFI